MKTAWQRSGRKSNAADGFATNEYSNSLWHTDYKKLDDGRWLIACQDDAPRFITGWGVFENATTQNAITVLEQAIMDHGKPAAVMTDHGTQFYANESEAKKRGHRHMRKSWWS